MIHWQVNHFAGQPCPRFICSQGSCIWVVFSINGAQGLTRRFIVTYELPGSDKEFSFFVVDLQRVPLIEYYTGQRSTRSFGANVTAFLPCKHHRRRARFAPLCRYVATSLRRYVVRRSERCGARRGSIKEGNDQAMSCPKAGPR